MHFIITEKHNTAKRIASILAPKKPKNVRVNGVDTYEFDDTVIMGLSGHIVGIDFPKEYNNWQKVPAISLVSSELVTVPMHRKIIATLKKLGKNADHVTIATDFDREGELIGVEALNIIQEKNPDVAFDRVRYSAITPIDIKNAFDNPTEIYFDLADAGQARQEIDLIWGAALTRQLSIMSGRLGKQFLSVGRVQSPTLALIVDREKERDAFVPVPYWEIHGTFKDTEEIVTKHVEDKIWDKEQVDVIMANVSDVSTATVASIKKGERRDTPPTPFNTTEFIRASSAIGFSPANAMRLAETLYTSGYTSYPRTDNTVYPKNLDLKELVSMYLKGEFAEYAKELLKKPLTPTRGKKETTDHPPIHPAAFVKKSALKEDEWKIYELIVRRFFATFATPAVWETMALRIDVNSELFKTNGARLVDAGWRWYYPYFKSDDRILPPLSEGGKLNVTAINVEDKMTKPPGRYGQGSLIKLMEDLGLGTKATRHEIIQKLYARAYVFGAQPQPTNTAIAVVEALEKYAPTITKPDMTSTLETDMDKIAEGDISKTGVVSESRDMLLEIFSELTENEEAISTDIRSGLRRDKIVGPCPDCGSNLIIRRSKRGSRFIGCDGYPDCTHSLPFPKSGQVIVSDKTCPEHGLNHIRIIGLGKRPWDYGCAQCNYDEWQKTLKENGGKIKVKSLEKISGLGPKTLEKLMEAGIETIEDLAKADVVELSKKLERISASKIRAWKDQVI
ncbi:MAG: DNA topoisomerase I [Methanosarcinales archaeon]|nr:DNA topoisomerase I [Methanosarcinales archaeon]